MPKGKPNKSVLKRVKFTATGKAKKRPPGKGHLLAHKTARRKRKLSRANCIPKNYMKRIRRAVKMQ